MRHLIFLFVIITPFCGPKYYFKKAEKLKQKEKYSQAIRIYRSIAKKSEIHAPEAIYRIGRTYQINLKEYAEAKKNFTEVLEKYPHTIWAEYSQLGIFNSPNYFPLVDKNRWIEGDSETGGKNMRVIYYCNEISTEVCGITGIFELRRSYYAGEKLVKSINLYLRKKDFQLRESDDLNFKHFSVVLQHPFEKGRVWETTRMGKKYRFIIEETDLEVKTRAGIFKNCFKIKQVDLEFPHAYKYEYYAPNVGKVLTTTASAYRPKEYRVSELISYDVKLE